MTLISPKSSYWLPEDEWRNVQKCIPIVCVDALPFRMDKGELREVGLILRNTPHQGERWCLVGGRLQYKESLKEGIIREIIETLGDKVNIKFTEDKPAKVVQYMPEEGLGEYFDPRQHAISLTYTVLLSGICVPQGEALDFKWFSIDQLYEMDRIGFGQKQIILDCLHTIDQISAFLTV